MRRTWMLVLGTAALVLWASPAFGQEAASTQSRLDTVTVYGMQFRIVAMSTTQAGGAPPTGVRSYSASVLENEGYTELGGFYVNGWVDPVSLDSMKRAVAVAEPPSSVGMENTNVVGGAVLVAGCDGDESFVQLRTPEPLTGDFNGEVSAAYRFAGLGPVEDPENWHAGAAGRWASLHGDEARNFLLNFGRSDSLFIRLSGASGENSTHAFNLEAAPKVHYRMGCLR